MSHRAIVLTSAAAAVGAGAPATAGILPLIVAIVAVITAACGGAVLLASILRLDLKWPWASHTKADAPRPDDVIRDLVRCAQQAARTGASSITTISRAPGLRRGLRLLAAGHSPEQIRQTLQRELDAELERRARGGLWPAIRAAGPGPLIGIGLIITGVVTLGGAAWGAGAIAAGAAMAALLAGLAALTLRPATPDQLARREAAEVLSRTLVIRGLSLIAAGATPNAVEQELRSLLPPAPAPSAADHPAPATRHAA